MRASPAAAEASTDPWDRAEAILERIDPPTIPDREFDVTEYGAVGDGETDCTAAFADAVEACSAAGGGRVVVPAGEFHTGAIHLADGVALHLADGATIAFSRDPEDYLPPVTTRYEGIEVVNYSPMVYAHDCEDVAITGSGTLDGRADEEHWWDWSGGESPNEYDSKDRLSAMVDDGVPPEERIFGADHHLRPCLVQFYECESVLVEGVTLTDSPMWHLHPVESANVTVREVIIDTPRGSNTDGCNAESCVGMHVVGCRFHTGDDCLSFKAGRSPDGPDDPGACRDALVEDCTMEDGNGGVVIGSETTGGVEHIYTRHCAMSSPNLKRALRMKSNAERGGYIRDVHVRDVDVGEVGGPLVEITLDYANVHRGPHAPEVDRIEVRDVTVDEAGRVLNLIGTADAPIGEVRLADCTIDEVRASDRITHVERLVFEDVEI